MATKLLGKGAAKATALINSKRTKPKMFHDGEGLWLRCAPKGSSWIFRYTSPITGKPRDKGLGKTTKMTLADARVEAERLRRMVHVDKKDPIIEAEKAGKSGQTFREAFDVMEKRNGENPDWRRMLELHAFPKIGDKSIVNLTVDNFAEIIAALEKVGKRETARKLQQRMNRVMEDATDSNDTPAHRKRIGRKVPSFKKVHKNKHYRSIDFANVPTFMRDLRACPDDFGALALEFLTLTVCRSGDIIGARKRKKQDAKPPLFERDIRDKVWIVPSIKTADGEEFEIPLSDAALDVLERAKALKKKMKLDTRLVFPLVLANGKCVSLAGSGMRDHIGRENRPFTVHGMRTAFKTWAEHKSGAANNVIETVMAHRVFAKDAAERAYMSKVDFFDQRRKLMAKWAAFATANKIVPLRKAA